MRPRLDVSELAQLVEHGVDLRRQLTRGREHQHVGGLHVLGPVQQALQQGESKGRGLAAAGDGAAADVAARQRQRDARRLRERAAAQTRAAVRSVCERGF